MTSVISTVTLIELLITVFPLNDYICDREICVLRGDFFGGAKPPVNDYFGVYPHSRRPVAVS